MTERLLSSLFLDYLHKNGFTFTISVFLPESQMVSHPPFSYDEMLELLHLDPSSKFHLRLKLVCDSSVRSQQVLILINMHARIWNSCFFYFGL